MSEEFEKWYEHSKDVTHVNTSRYFIAEKAWQAARELDAKRIAELESQNKVMREALEFYANGTPAQMTARGHYATDVRMEYDRGVAQNALSSLKKEG